MTKLLWQLVLLQFKSKFICFGDNNKSNGQPLHPLHANREHHMFLRKRKPWLFNKISTYGKGIATEENTGNSSSCSVWRVHLLPIRKSVGQKYELKTSMLSLTFWWPGDFVFTLPTKKSRQSKWNTNFTKREQKLNWFPHIHVMVNFEDSY